MGALAGTLPDLAPVSQESTLTTPREIEELDSLTSQKNSGTTY